METMSTVTAYEKTPSGAHKITLMGGHVAGTFDDDIGAVAERLAAEGDDANPIAIRLEKRDDKVFITAMKEILPPPELGGPGEDRTRQQASTPTASSSTAQQIAGDEAHSPGADSAAPSDAPTQAAADQGAAEVAVSAAPDPVLEVETMIHQGEIIVEADRFDTAVDNVRGAHVVVNEIISDLDNVGIVLVKLDDVVESLAEAARQLKKAPV